MDFNKKFEPLDLLQSLQNKWPYTHLYVYKAIFTGIHHYVFIYIYLTFYS